MSRFEFGLAVIVGLLMYKHGGWTKAAQLAGEAIRPALAFTPPDLHRPHPYAKAIRAGLERGASERRHGRQPASH